MYDDTLDFSLNNPANNVISSVKHTKCRIILQKKNEVLHYCSKKSTSLFLMKKKLLVLKK
jgi:hypothetical protein